MLLRNTAQMHLHQLIFCTEWVPSEFKSTVDMHGFQFAKVTVTYLFYLWEYVLMFGIWSLGYFCSANLLQSLPKHFQAAALP